MPSSLTPPVQSQPEGQPALLALLASVPDPRDPRGVRHALPVLLAVAITAVMAGARSFTAIGEWAADQGAGVLAGLGVRALARPDESTIRRALVARGANHTCAVPTGRARPSAT